MVRQLRLVRPDRVVDTKRLTDRQHALWEWVKGADRPVTAREVGRLRFKGRGALDPPLLYADPNGALRRLEQRGLLRQVGRGVYAVRLVRERKL